MEDIVQFCHKTINITQEIITTESSLKTSTSNNRFQEITPLRPVLSMPGSPYHKITQKVTDWLSVVPESKIDSSTPKMLTARKE